MPSLKNTESIRVQKYKTHRYIATLWNKDFYLEKIHLCDPQSYNEDALFLNSAGFRKTVQNLFSRLRNFGVLNLFWKTEEMYFLILKLKNFFDQFEKLGLLYVHLDFERNNLCVINPNTKFLKVDLELEFCEYVYKQQFRKKYEKQIHRKKSKFFFKRKGKK